MGNRAFWYPKGWVHSLSGLEKSVRKSGTSLDPETLKCLVSIQGTKGFSIPLLHRETESFPSPSWKIFFGCLPGSPHSGEFIGSRCMEKDLFLHTHIQLVPNQSPSPSSPTSKSSLSISLGERGRGGEKPTMWTHLRTVPGSPTVPHVCLPTAPQRSREKPARTMKGRFELTIGVVSSPTP